MARYANTPSSHRLTRNGIPKVYMYIWCIMVNKVSVFGETYRLCITWGNWTKL